MRPTTGREKLTVITGAHATCILIKGDRATGIEYRSGTHRARGAQVILSGGTFASPQLLMLSGIGPAQHLRDLGVRSCAICRAWGKLKTHPGLARPDIQLHFVIAMVDDHARRPTLGPRL